MAKKWNYGDAYLRHPIEEDETFVLDKGRGIIKVHDMYNRLPEFMLTADMIITDPPWNLSNVNTFYTKAEKRGEHKNKYIHFCEQIFKNIDLINPKKLYIEMGNQNYKYFVDKLSQRFRYIQVWDVTYYKKFPCKFIRASKDSLTNINFEGMDEWDAILLACKNEEYKVVADICMGQGLVGYGAYLNNRNFVGTELNKKRLSVLIEKIHNLGGRWEKRS